MEGIREYNDRKGRRTEVCGGKLSFNQAFHQSIQENPVIRATTEQLRVAMLVAERRTARKPSGDLWFKDNRYWAAFMNDHIGERVIIRFDPDSLHSGVHVHPQWFGNDLRCGQCQIRPSVRDKSNAIVWSSHTLNRSTAGMVWRSL